MTTSRSDPGDAGQGASGDLFEGSEAYARETDPLTADSGAQVMRHSGRAASLTASIMSDLTRLKAQGITTFEFTEAHPEAERVSVSPRFSHLYKARKIGKHGARHRPGQKKGATSAIYVLLSFATHVHDPEEDRDIRIETTGLCTLPADTEDDEPKANSPEDLGLVTPTPRPYGVETPEPEKPSSNASSHAVQVPDLHKFIDWIHDQDFPVHADVKVGHCAIAFSGLCVADLRWLCQACRQAGRAPAPATMAKAVFRRDVSILRPGHDLETSQRWPKTGA